MVKVAYQFVCKSLFTIIRLTYVTDGYMTQHVTKACSSAAALTTIEECRIAKAIIEPSASPVKTESTANVPTGCSRYAGWWYFNTNSAGKLDGVSKPVCKVTAGKSHVHRICSSSKL